MMKWSEGSDQDEKLLNYCIEIDPGSLQDDVSVILCFILLRAFQLILPCN